MTSAIILIAHGTEEMEFTITYDTLVRAGIHCTSAFVHAVAPNPHVNLPDPVIAKGSRGIQFVPDIQFIAAECTPDKYDLLVVPGGAKGAETLSQNVDVQAAIRAFLDADKYVGMICAGSLAALTSKLPKQPLTSHPSVKGQLESHFEYSEDSVVVSGKLVTSRGPGTTFPFALTLVELLVGKDRRQATRDPMVFPSNTPF